MMRNNELRRQRQRLQNVIQETENATAQNLELQSHWAKYICVLSAGFLENAIKELYSEFARRTVSQPLSNFVESNLSSISNPKSKRFLETAGAFKSEWKDELENFLNDEGRREAIDSIMNQRHLIAHGKLHNSNITIVQIKDYLSKAVEVLEFIETQCDR